MEPEVREFLREIKKGGKKEEKKGRQGKEGGVASPIVCGKIAKA